MIRLNILIVLLSVWIFAILAPPIITLLNDEGNAVISINITEEEQQEQGKKNLGEKLILENNSPSAYLLAHLQNLGFHDFYLLGHYDRNSEIVLPPPEPIS
ncbi:hypothetical protein [Maribacter polysiphoniae]|uniref:hypothetical protein n=1 Tax=Maribacter polysiphoniae TaxID=429344 RepID=UPI002352BA12|nr:hypothetical protein [Maribacter polysiphoniae]